MPIIFRLGSVRIPIEGRDPVRTSRLILIPMLISLAGPASAGDPSGIEGITTDPQALSDADLERRIQWLETNLDDGSGYSKLWQYGWTGSSSFGAVIGAVQAATTSNEDTRVNAIVTASRGVIGTARFLLAPHPGRLGAQPMRDITGNDRDAKLRRLAAGENQLLKVADRAEQRLHWQRHAGNVALNLIGGAFVLGFGNKTDAAISVAMGITVGELMIFTSPKRGKKEIDAYREHFAGAPRSKWTVSFVPTARGAGIRVDF